MKRFYLLLTPALFAAACGNDAATQSIAPAGSRNVVQGGAQDFAQFRSIVERGEVPAPDTLDDVGFFAEHALDLPPADCGDPVCIHPMLAVAPRFDGGNWTMAFVAMNSSVDPAALPRPPTHVVVVVEESIRTVGADFGAHDGIIRMIPGLEADDRMSVIGYGDDVVVRIEQAQADDPDLRGVYLRDRGTSGAALYDALARAAEVATSSGAPELARIVLVTSGMANVGITSHDRIVALGETIASRGIALSVFGVGTNYDQRLPLALGELGAGTYTYAENARDLATAMELEGETMLYPLARDLELTVKAAAGYEIGRIYGVARARRTQGEARLSIPAVFLGHRTGANDVDRGRRGGGGGMFVELIADADSGIGANENAATVGATYDAERPRQISLDITNSLPPGRNPAEMWPEFSDPARGKAFMMLNMYLALKTTVEFYEKGDCASALGVIQMMGPTIEAWQAEFEDPDISDDTSVMLDLRDNIQVKCTAVQPIPPRAFHGGCFGI